MKALQRPRPHYPALFIGGALTLMVSAASALWVGSRNQRESAERFSALAERVVSQIEQRFRTYEYGLRGARGAMLASGGENVSLQQFQLYSSTRDVKLEFPGAIGFGFIRKVESSRIDSFVDQMRREGRPDFAVKQIGPNHGDGLIIQFIEPAGPNAQAVGLDIGSEQHRREAATAATDSGRATMTAPITLVQASGKKDWGLLLLLPVYRAGLTTSNEGERRQAVFGWTYTPLIVDQVLAGFDMRGNEFGFSVSDSEANASFPFFVVGKNTVADAKAPKKVLSLDVYGRVWKIRVWATPGFTAALNHTSPWIVWLELLAAGMALTALANLYIVNQARLREHHLARSRLAAVVDTSHDAIVGKSPDGTITDWNPAAERLFGYSAKQVIGKKAVDLFVPPHLAEEEAKTLAAVSRGVFVPSFRTQRIGRGGHLIDVLLNVSPVAWNGDSLSGLAVTIHDITNIVAFEKQVSALNSSLEKQVAERTFDLTAALTLQSAIVDQAGYAVVATDSTGTITLFNRAAEQMLGYAANQVMWRETPALFHDPAELEERARALSLRTGREVAAGLGVFKSILRLQNPDVDTWTYLRSDGSPIQVRLSLTRLRSPEGRDLGFLGIAMDLTEQINRETELQAAKSAAEQAGQAKADFLANMSHEIRTPLNGIIGYADLALEDQTLSAGSRRNIARVFEASNSLRVIIDDILSFSKIEAQGVDLDPAPCRLHELADNCSSIVMPKVREQDLSLEARIGDDVPAVVLADGSRLRQVLINLLNNAVKFTAKGSVTLEIVCTAQKEDGVRLRFSVTDTGIGISSEDQKKLFQRFNQADSSISRKYGGTGLGLVISKRIIEAMGGELQLESEPGNGSTFWFDVELRLAEDAELHFVEAPSLAVGRALRILAVDDVEMNRDLCKAILYRAGHMVTVAASGSEAVTLSQSEAFDLILMDVQMPGMDGMETTRRIRARETGSRRIPIIALTANVMPDQVSHYKASGMDDHIGKPIAKAQLLKALDRWGAQIFSTGGDDADAPPETTIHDAEAFRELREFLSDEAVLSLTDNLRVATDQVPSLWTGQAAADELNGLRIAAHKAVALSGQLGFAHLADAFAGVENACSEPTNVAQAVNRLKAAIHLAHPEIERISKLCAEPVS